MGIYRYILAILVAMSHCRFFIMGFNEGAVAVVSFILLSGYVMTILIATHYRSLKTVPLFYVDRLGRLLPQFLFYSVLALALLQFTRIGATQHNSMTYSTCRASTLAWNFSIFGNNFYQTFGECMLIPASWSLGLEAFFYLVIPWIILLNMRPVSNTLVFLSGIIFLLGYLRSINSDLYAYRYLPGTFYIFLAGGAVARSELFGKALPFIILECAAILLFCARNAHDIYYGPEIKEVLVGLIIGIPMLLLLSRVKFSGIDEFMGNISYGVFLNHVLCKWAAETYLGIGDWHLPQIAGLVVAASLFSCVSYYFIERPALIWRRNIRLAASKSE